MFLSSYISILKKEKNFQFYIVNSKNFNKKLAFKFRVVQLCFYAKLLNKLFRKKRKID